MAITILPALPPMPRASRTRPPQACACGCAGLTRGGRFLPGHDAILLGWAIRIERGLITEAPAPHTAAAAAMVAERAKKAARG